MEALPIGLAKRLGELRIPDPYWDVPRFVVVDGAYCLLDDTEGTTYFYFDPITSTSIALKIEEVEAIWEGMLKEVDSTVRVQHSAHSGYECSTKGDKVFSALTAQPTSLKGRTIEMGYQLDVKGYGPGGTDWRLGKGRPPLMGISVPDLWKAYYAFWKEWCDENPVKVQELRYLVAKSEYVVRDSFAGGIIDQARALSQYLNDNPLPPDLF